MNIWKHYVQQYARQLLLVKSQQEALQLAKEMTTVLRLLTKLEKEVQNENSHR